MNLTFYIYISLLIFVTVDVCIRHYSKFPFVEISPTRNVDDCLSTEQNIGNSDFVGSNSSIHWLIETEFVTHIDIHILKALPTTVDQNLNSEFRLSQQM